MDKLSTELWENMKKEKIRQAQRENELDEKGRIVCQSFFDFPLPISEHKLLQVWFIFWVSK